VSADAEELIKHNGFEGEQADECRQWFAYWESLTHEQQREEIAAMDAYVVEREGEQ